MPTRENSSRSRRAASPIPARAAGRIQKPANAGDSSQAGVSEPPAMPKKKSEPREPAATERGGFNM